MRRQLREPREAALVLAVLRAADLSAEAALGAVAEAFGAIAALGAEFAFTQTDYYQAEMGPGLAKRFVRVDGFHERGSLARHKLAAAALEARFLAPNGGRRLNVDPMLVSLENIVVASSKSHPHRVYLSDGVFGDPQLLRRRGRFEALPWTYRDYAENLDFFERVHAGLPRAG